MGAFCWRPSSWPSSASSVSPAASRDCAIYPERAHCFLVSIFFGVGGFVAAAVVRPTEELSVDGDAGLQLLEPVEDEGFPRRRTAPALLTNCSSTS